jgi:uncharacterized membrane protein (DUF4010 family)
LLGAICGTLTVGNSPWLIGFGLLSLSGLLVAVNVLGSRQPNYDPGITTELALLVVFLVGVLTTQDQRTLAVVLGATTAVLLHLRTRLHDLARGLSEGDMRAIMQFVVVALVVLPLLPDRGFGPGGVLNPRQIWWMVVLITGIGLASYVAASWLGGKTGALAGGILGGLISSTATTASYARRSRELTQATSLAALVIMLASTVVFGRVLFLIAMVCPEQFRQVFPPVAAMLVLTAGLSALLWWRSRGQPAEMPASTNPTELKVALGFAVLYALVLLAVSYGREFFGDRGLYGVAFLSGLTDMDAITLSTATLVRRQELDGTTGGKVILLASLSNLIFKGGMVAVLGTAALRRQIFVLFGILLLGGGLILIWG